MGRKSVTFDYNSKQFWGNSVSLYKIRTKRLRYYCVCSRGDTDRHGPTTTHTYVRCKLWFYDRVYARRTQRKNPFMIAAGALVSKYIHSNMHGFFFFCRNPTSPSTVAAVIVISG